jgi:hypothetical protein
VPTIRVITTSTECVYEADRVVRDSQFLVVEVRREQVWAQVGCFSAPDVVGVHRLVPGAHGDRWLAEDVRVGAGLGPTATGSAPPVSPPWRRFLRRRASGAEA